MITTANNIRIKQSALGMVVADAGAAPNSKHLYFRASLLNTNKTRTTSGTLGQQGGGVSGSDSLPCCSITHELTTPILLHSIFLLFCIFFCIFFTNYHSHPAYTSYISSLIVVLLPLVVLHSPLPTHSTYLFLILMSIKKCSERANQPRRPSRPKNLQLPMN